MSTKAQRKRFERQLREMLLGLGARTSERCYEMALDTPAGTLELQPYDDWLAGRFVDPEHARHFVDCNPYSGKWNFHEWQILGGEPAPALAAIYARIKTLLAS